jgi:hypothetical protein
MSTITKDKSGKVIKELQDTKYHRDGTGPRDARGKPITDRVPEASPTVAGAVDSTPQKETQR